MAPQLQGGAFTSLDPSHPVGTPSLISLWVGRAEVWLKTPQEKFLSTPPPPPQGLLTLPLGKLKPPAAPFEAPLVFKVLILPRREDGQQRTKG